MRRLCCLALLALGMILVGVPGAAQQKDSVKIETVKYDGLKDAVARQRGKVVLVDFWGTLCPPCIKGMPHVVELHQKYAKEGFTVITVCVDDFKDMPEAKTQAPKILKDKGATAFTNLHLDEPFEMWSKKVRCTAIPCLYVFNRQGKWTQFFDAEKPIDHEAVAKLVGELVREK